MSIKKYQKKHLVEMVEQVLLNENELGSLKLLINDLSSGKIESKQLKMAIIKSRAEALKRIIEIFPFFHKQILNQQEIDNFTVNDNNSNPELVQELKEKNSFLEEVGNRIDKIVNQLKN